MSDKSNKPTLVGYAVRFGLGMIGATILGGCSHIGTILVDRRYQKMLAVEDEKKRIAELKLQGGSEATHGNLRIV